MAPFNLIPLHDTEKLTFFTVAETEKEMSSLIPLFIYPVSAGFPSPAEDYIELSVDFNSYLIAKPDATFCVKVKGNSMQGAGILDGSMLIVTPRNSVEK